MIRTQVQFTEPQADKLKRVAAQKGISMAAVVREAVDALPDDDREERWQRALSVIGKYRDCEGASDVAVEHDRYLEEAYLDWRR